MSIFSKLFPGDAKTDDTTASSPSAAEKVPPVPPQPVAPGRRPPPQAASQEQKVTAASPQRPPAQKPPARRPPSGHPKAPTRSSAASTSGVKAAVASPPPAPAVVITRPIEVGANAAQRSRPAMPVISIGPPTAPTAVAAPATPTKGAPSAAVAPTLSSDETSQAAPGHGQHVKPPQVELDRPSSVRPTAPEMSAPNGGPASISDTFERLLSAEDLDAGFASLEHDWGVPEGHGLAATDLAEVRVLFAQLAANHVRQVRDFMIDLRWSEPTVDWLPICEPAMRSLRRAADKLDLAELCVALDKFSEALAATQATGARTIGGEHRAALLARYEELSGLMPQAFALDLDRSQREAVIMQSLLLQVRDVKKVTLDKMYAAGLTTLEAMFLATPGDIAATTGIPEALAARIVERFRTYHEQVKTTVPDATRAQERQRIAELMSRLRREHEEYSRASESWSRDASERKKELRKARAQTLLDIQVELARLGEVERLDQLERLPFEKKLAHLESFLEEARDKYVAQS
jgi:hypothetical protein